LKIKESELNELRFEFEQYKKIEAQTKEEEMKEFQQEIERLNSEIEQANSSVSKTQKEKESELDKLKLQIQNSLDKEKMLQQEAEKLKKMVTESKSSDSNQIQQLLNQIEEYKNKYQEELNKRQQLESAASSRSNSSDGNSNEIALLQAEVTKWMQSAQQLEQLGTEAVQEVYAELEKERNFKNDLLAKYEEEKTKREKVEEELLISDQKVKQLDGVMQRLMNINITLQTK